MAMVLLIEDELTATDKPAARVKLQNEVETASIPPLQVLQTYAPTKIALIAPPYEFAPFDPPEPVDVTALQFQQDASIMRTVTPVALVEPLLLLLPISDML